MQDGKRGIHPGLKFVLEFGPLILFFGGYMVIRDRSFVIGGTEYAGFIVMSAVFIPLLLISSAMSWKLTGELSKMQVVTAVLVVVFGGLTVWFNDERFFKIKPTIIYLLFAGILGFGLLRGRSFIEYAMGGELKMHKEGWMIMTRWAVGFCLALAAANEVIWRMMSTDFWVTFKSFGVPGLTMLFFVSQFIMLRKYIAADEA